MGNSEAAKVVVIDDDPLIGQSIALVLEGEGLEVAVAGAWDQAARAAVAGGCGVVILDVYLGSTDGRTVLAELLDQEPGLPVLMISGQATYDEAVAAVRRGAFDFLEKPLKPDRLVLSVRNALAHARLFRDSLGRILPVAASPAMKGLVDAAQRVARSSSTVLIRGESGSGKDLAARLVHSLSPRHDRPMVHLNCAALPADLVESELFGHARGAFTGAVSDQAGKLQQAHQSSLFLDEIGDLPLAAQAKFLRFLETGEVQRLGEARVGRADVRVIAATHRDLETMVRAGSFREDLLYRLNVLPLAVPPLRERREDIGPLVEYFLLEAGRRLDMVPPQLEPGALAALEAHDWPGNVRELRNLMERLIHFSAGLSVGPEDLPWGGRSGRPGSAGPGGAVDGQPGGAGPDRQADPLFAAASLAEARDNFEAAYLAHHLALNGHSVQATARSLGLLPNNLSRRLHQLGVERQAGP